MTERYKGYDLDILARELTNEVVGFVKNVSGKQLETYQIINLFWSISGYRNGYSEISVIGKDIDKLFKTHYTLPEWIDAPEDHSLINVIGYSGHCIEGYTQRLNTLLRNTLKRPCC